VAKLPVDPSSIRLERGKGSAGRGAGAGGRYWHIYQGDERVGNVYVNEIDEAPLGRHASLQIQINKAHQRRGIGKVAYRLASEDSGHDVVYAHMRKSNAGSRRAAQAAGYEVVEDDRIGQLLMRWTRSR
jgi:RimJ/RimL family protein N-acetyltransferase